MLILYVACKYDYGDPSRGLSFEHYNFFSSLNGCGFDIIYFDVATLTKRRGYDAMNRLLLEVVEKYKPDLTFCVLTGDQVKKSLMRRLSKSDWTTTVNWYCDDHFNFETFSRRWTPCFNWVVTTSQGCMPKYQKLGYKNVIKSQWACNQFAYRRTDSGLRYDVTFVGVNHGNRPKFIQALRSSGVEVSCWGKGWENGRVDQNEMIEIFNSSRINLNFSNGAFPPTVWQAWSTRQRVEFRRKLESSEMGRSIQKLWHSRKNASEVVSKEAAEVYQPSDLTKLVPDGSLQIKGRNFEVPGCGGLLLTGLAENMIDYYRDNEEICTFSNGDELVNKVRFLLANEESRQAIANAGYARTLAEHTYVHRFRDIFQKIGINDQLAVEKILTNPPGYGEVEEID